MTKPVFTLKTTSNGLVMRKGKKVLIGNKEVVPVWAAFRSTLPKKGEK